MAKKAKKIYPPDPRAKKIVDGMEPWFQDVNKKLAKASWDGRTDAERRFDSGIFAAAEFVRLLTGNEDLSLMIHECCVWRRRELAPNSRPTAEGE